MNPVPGSTIELEVLPARHGDCMILHYGPDDDRRRILIDGGPAKVYEPILRPRLEELRGDRESIDFEMLLVSHIDDDHINGILDLFEELCEQRSTRGRRAPLAYRFGTLWHNSFDDLLARGADALQNAALDEFEIRRPRGRGEGLEPAVVERPGEARPPLEPATVERRARATENLAPGGEAVAASVPQGRELRRMAKTLRIPINRGLPRREAGRLVIAEPDRDPVDLGHGLSFRVLGPPLRRITRLQTIWDRELVRRGLVTDDPSMDAPAVEPPGDDRQDDDGQDDAGDAAEPASAIEPAAFVDRSVFNLASLIVLAEHDDGQGGRTRMLLPGDARGDDILDGLEEAGLMTDFEVSVEERGRRRRRPPRKVKKGGIHLDLLKLPHHGSDRNVTTDFFRQVRADRYVISGDGRHHNPEPATFQMIFDARREDQAPFSLELTYGLDDLHHQYPLDALQRVLADARADKIDFTLSVGPPGQ